MPHRHSNCRRLLSVGGLGAWVFCLGFSTLSLAQVGPEESARKLKPADGLEATLWASEPLVNNPTNMDVDARGRVWVTEGLNYRLHRPRNSGFKKQDEADRIKILEDTDGDGKADKVTVFADKIFPVPMGLAVEERYGNDGKYLGCRVFIGNSPDLLVLEDTDGDDKADKRYPLLSGFGGVDSDHGVHGMVLGLDGKLYFTHGDGCCSVQQDHSEKVQNFDVVDKSGRHVSSDQLANTLRVNRDGTQFEVLADRQRNNYETSLNSFGNIFTSDNDDDGNAGSRVIWVMDGGRYGYRTPGSPRHWGEEVPGNVPKLVGTGNGSPCGIMVYEGKLFPKEYEGAVLEADAGTRQINFFPIERAGAAFRTKYKVFLGSDDPWFRPVDVTAGPDGSIFVADWYDAGVGGHAFKDQDTGRIYRVRPIGGKLEPAKMDFASVPGLIHALRSPVVSAQDAARRSLIERAKDKGEKKDSEPNVEVTSALVKLFSSGQPHERARALWVLHAIVGDQAAVNALEDKEPRIREQAVRILGRDVRENGKVEYQDSSSRQPAPALAHLKVLLPLAADPDAGVRRELLLAIRNLPTPKVRDALRTLARTWDGQDRWYLEALGLAIETRELRFLESLLDGTLYGDLEEKDRRPVALPPYFPVDRNEAYIAVGTKDLPSSALSKTLGLAWRVHQPIVLPLLARVAPMLDSPELQQASDDIVLRIVDPDGASAVATLASESNDPTRKRKILDLLARKLEGDWASARSRPEVIQVIETSLKDPLIRPAAIAAAAATGDQRFAEEMMNQARDQKASEELRVAAVEALGQLKPPRIQQFFDEQIKQVQGKPSSNGLAEAAVRTLPKLGKADKRLAELLLDREYPLGLRREALRTLARSNEGGFRVLALAREKKLPDDLITEATTVAHSHPNTRVRNEAANALPLPKTKSGRPIPSMGDLIRLEGRADRGRDVFFRSTSQPGLTVSCGGCHRVQGRGEWVGPDLSTIGTKYGRDELFRSILNPSAAIGYNYKTNVVATKDGQVYTGLPVEDSPDRLTLKTAEAKRITLRPGDVEERTTNDVSLMPEGLAESLTNEELADLIAFLTTLRQPVSIVGQYQAIGPVADSVETPAFDVSAKVNLRSTLVDPEGRKVTWRRLDANAEGRGDLSTLAPTEPKQALYLYVPVRSPIAQDAQLVIDTEGDDLHAWFNGRSVNLARTREHEPRSVFLQVPEGASELLIRVPGGSAKALVTTLVADRPLEFSVDEAKSASR